MVRTKRGKNRLARCIDNYRLSVSPHHPSIIHGSGAMTENRLFAALTEITVIHIWLDGRNPDCGPSGPRNPPRPDRSVISTWTNFPTVFSISLKPVSPAAVADYPWASSCLSTRLFLFDLEREGSALRFARGWGVCLCLDCLAGAWLIIVSSVPNIIVLVLTITRQSTHLLITIFSTRFLSGHANTTIIHLNGHP